MLLFFSGRPADEYNDSPDEPPEVIARSAPLLILGSTMWVKKVQVLQRLESFDLDSLSTKKKWTAIFEVREELLKSGQISDSGLAEFRKQSGNMCL